MTDKYGPWIAFNPGDTPPADDVMVQVQLASETRVQVVQQIGKEERADSWNWTFSGNPGAIIAYRVVKQPVRGEVVYDGTLRTFYSLHAGLTAKFYDKETDHCHVTFTTADGLLIPGTYTGPDGATVKIEVL